MRVLKQTIQIFLLLFYGLSFSQKKHLKNDSFFIQPISIDKDGLSGLNLKAVKNKHQPKRKLFQKNLFIGKEIGVFIVASETAGADWEEYAIDEFIFVLNGRAKLHSKEGKPNYFNKGDFFVAPKGYNGSWETQGGKSYYCELSVVALNRDKTKSISGNSPISISKTKLNGIGITESNNQTFTDVLFKGIDLTVKTISEKPIIKKVENSKGEQLIYVLSGKVTLISNEQKHTFYTNEFFILPKGFSGTWQSNGHSLFRSLHITKTK